MNDASVYGAASPGGGGLSPTSVTLLGLTINVVLAMGKMLFGLAVTSQALVADGVHSLSDLASDAAVLAGLRVSRKPADQTHHYGHLRVQTLVTLFIGAMLMILAVWAAGTAIHRWRHDVVPHYGWGPFGVLAVSVAVKEWLYRVTRGVGRRYGDSSLLANAWHHRSDAFSSVAAAAGVFGVALGGPEWGYLDHVTAIAFGGLLVAMGGKMVFESSQELIDRAPAQHVMDSIAQVVRGTEGVRSYHAFRIRRLGGRLEMDVHVQVDPRLSVVQGHDIATDVRRRIFQADPSVTTVLVHVEPAEGTPFAGASG